MPKFRTTIFQIMARDEAKYVLAIDQGTTSTRAILWDRNGRKVETAQEEHEQITNTQGWTEHDPEAIWEKTVYVIQEVLRKRGATAKDIAALGITNQRETTLVWDKSSGKPLYNAIVWMDTRASPICQRVADENGGRDAFRSKTGLPIVAYFSASKLAWMMENVDAVRDSAERGEAMFGTIDSWLIYKLTGGEVHATDVTNASRTLLLDIRSLEWDRDLVRAFGVDKVTLPEVKPSVGKFGICRIKELEGVVIGGVLGDQQSALFGQACFKRGDTKNTYGTGCFMLQNTGEKMTHSSHGMLTTVAYKIEGQPTVYALEGSVAQAGSVVQWLRDKLKVIRKSSEVGDLAKAATDKYNGYVYLVPAFTGLFAPRWASHARGVIVGLTGGTSSSHVARAALEATGFQSNEMLRAMVADSGTETTRLRVDGGMTVNDELLQFQADVTRCNVIRPAEIETTALGAAFAAGLAVGIWKSTDQLANLWRHDRMFNPKMPKQEAEQHIRGWNRAVARSYHLAGPPDDEPQLPDVKSSNSDASWTKILAAGVAGAAIAAGALYALQQYKKSRN